MKILIIGGNGSIGKRYQAIMRHENILFEVVDDQNGVDLSRYSFDKALIASPTATHKDYCMQLVSMKKEFLCEKPLAQTQEEAQFVATAAKNVGVQAAIVCNWKVLVERLVRNIYPPYKIVYDYYNTGNEDLKWNMAQLIYLDSWVRIYTDSPRWNVQINGQDIKYRQLEHSYVLMIKDWVSGLYQNLWTLEDGVKMVSECNRWDKRHGKAKR